MWSPAGLSARVRDQLARRQGDARRRAGRGSLVRRDAKRRTGRSTLLGAAYGLRAFGVHTARVVHHGDAEASVRRREARVTRGRQFGRARRGSDDSARCPFYFI
jgi:hypothetical protein